MGDAKKNPNPRHSEDPVALIPPFDPDELQETINDVHLEIHRQDALARKGRFGGTHILPGGTDLQRLAVSEEEAGEVAMEVCKGIASENRYQRRDGLYEELIQTAACYAAWACAVREGRPG